MKNISFLCLALSLFVAGCATRSISDSGYSPHGRYGRSSSGFRGELSEFDVLGITREVRADQPVTEAEIQKALESAKRVRIKRGGSVLLIQSGAAFPDGPMVSEMNKHFITAPISGVPPGPPAKTDEAKTDLPAFSKSLRLTAARGGNETIICYWGILESARESLVTKTVSWVPVVSWVAPDERQQMRIRLKLAVIDVRTGNWTMLSPEPFVDSAWSTSHRRESSDQTQVNTLKQKSYEAAVRDLVKACLE